MLVRHMHWINMVAPVIYNMAPELPTTGGVLAINGTNFGQNASLVSASLFVAGNCSIVSTVHTLINCILPQGTGASKKFTLTVDGQTTHTNYTYQSN